MNSGHGLSDSQSTDRLTMSTPSASAAHSTTLVITIPLIQKFFQSLKILFRQLLYFMVVLDRRTLWHLQRLL
jgi:hypothetical protein